MRNKVIRFCLIVMLSMIWPFSCNPQSGIGIGGKDGCDTIFIESEEAEELNIMIARLTEDNKILNIENKSLFDANTGLKSTVAAQTATIATKNSEISAMEADVSGKEAEIASLTTENTNLAAKVEELENRQPEKVTDTVLVESEFITVGGKEYKVSDIELILPNQTVDTIEMFFCQYTTGKRKFIHEGSITEYPHFINIASKNRGMVKVWFETPLDSAIKVTNSWMLRRIRSHKEAKTELTFIKSNN